MSPSILKMAMSLLFLNYGIMSGMSELIFDDFEKTLIFSDPYTPQPRPLEKMTKINKNKQK